MRRVTTRLVIAAVVIAAFVATAGSGLVLYVPGRLVPVFGISLLEWRGVHEWGALALVAAVAAHVVVNRRRVGDMLAGLVRPDRPRMVSTPASGESQGPREDLEEQAGAAADESPRVRLSRRWFLVLAGGAAASAIAALGLARTGSRSAGSGPAGLLENFPVLNVESGPPAVAAARWVVRVDGLVEGTLSIDRAAWLGLPRTQETRDFHCVEGWSVDHVGWEGVRVADLLSLAKPQAGGRFVTFHAYGGTYSDSLTLAEAQAPETLLADSLDGKPLPPAHGGPLRLVIPSQLGYKNVKWVARLEVTATRAQGYWERNGDYPAEAPVA
jgi:hypothetical protein